MGMGDEERAGSIETRGPIEYQGMVKGLASELAIAMAPQAASQVAVSEVVKLPVTTAEVPETGSGEAETSKPKHPVYERPEDLGEISVGASEVRREKVLLSVPEGLEEWIDKEDRIFRGGAWFVEDDSLITRAKEAKQAEEDEFSVIDDEVLPYVEVWVLGNPTAEGKPVFYARKDEIEEARNRKEYEDGVVASKQSDYMELVRVKQQEAAEKRAALSETYFTFSLVAELLADGEYRHIVAEALSAVYQSSMAMGIEQAAGIEVSTIQQFLDKNADTIKTAIEEDKSRFTDLGNNPDEYFVIGSKLLRRFHPLVLPAYLKFLLQHVHGSEFNSALKDIESDRVQAPAPVIAKSNTWTKTLSLFRNTVPHPEVEESTAQSDQKPQARSLAARIAEIEQHMADGSEAQARADEALESMLKKIQATLQERGFDTGIQMNDKLQPLLLETDQHTTYQDLCDIMELEEDQYSLNIKSRPDENGKIRINKFLLHGVADENKGDAIDDFFFMMGDTKTGVPVIEKGVNQKIGHVGLIRPNGNKSFAGSFFVEGWLDSVETKVKGVSGRDCRVFAFRLTDQTTIKLLGEYLSFFAPGGRQATGNLDQRVPHMINLLQQSVIAADAGNYLIELATNRAKAVIVQPVFGGETQKLMGSYHHALPQSTSQDS